MPTSTADHRPQRDPYYVPHRKNAAEWLMWFALLPLLPVAHLIARIRNRRGRDMRERIAVGRAMPVEPPDEPEAVPGAAPSDSPCGYHCASHIIRNPQTGG